MATQTRDNWDAIPATGWESKVTEHFPSLQKVLLDNTWLNKSSSSPNYHTIRSWFYKNPISSSHFLLPKFSFLQKFLPWPLQALVLFAYFDSWHSPSPRGKGYSERQYNCSIHLMGLRFTKHFPIAVFSKYFKISFKHAWPLNTWIVVRNNWQLVRKKTWNSGLKGF